MADSFWKEEILVEEVPKKGKEVYRVSLVKSKSDSWFLSFREWYLGDDEDMHPGKGGAVIPIDSLEGLTRAFTKAMEQVEV